MDTKHGRENAAAAGTGTGVMAEGRLRLEDINRSQIFRDTGISMSHLSRVFNGDRRPSLTMSRRITESLSKSLGWDVTLDDLYILLESVVHYNLRGRLYQLEGGREVSAVRLSA